MYICFTWRYDWSITPVKGYIMVKIIQISIILIEAVSGSEDEIPIKLLTNSFTDDIQPMITYKVVSESRMVRFTSTTMST